MGSEGDCSSFRNFASTAGFISGNTATSADTALTAACCEATSESSSLTSR